MTEMEKSSVYFPRDAWAKITPEAAGIPAQALENLLARAERDNMRLHGLILLKEGRVLLEHYWDQQWKNSPENVRSVTKSVVSLLAGIAISEGLLDEDAAVSSFFPRWPFGSRRRQAFTELKVRHLLSLTSGQKKDSNWNRKNAVRGFFRCPPTVLPGSRFAYMNGCFTMVSAILQRVTGKSLLEYADEKLFAPLGIEKPVWDITPGGVCTGGSGLWLKTSDVARIGLLLLAGGKWDETQIVPQAYIEKATSAQWTFPEGDRHLGYGYGFWLNALLPGMYYGVGLHGHYCIVLPQHGIVCAATAHGDMHLLPQALADEIVRNRLPRELIK